MSTTSYIVTLHPQYVAKPVMFVVRKEPSFSVLFNGIVMAKDKLREYARLLRNMVTNFILLALLKDAHIFQTFNRIV